MSLPLLCAAAPAKSTNHPSIEKGAEITVGSYNEVSRAFTIEITGESDSGPYYADPQELALAVGKGSEIKKFLETMHDTVEEHRSTIMPLIKERDQLIKKNLPIKQHLEKIFAIKESQRTIRTLMREMKKVVNAIELRPCIVDYAINYGIKDVESIWQLALQQNVDLFSPVMFPNIGSIK